MRTVHETEALRPSDPIPKSHPNHPQNIANTAYADALFRRQSKAISNASNGDGSFRVMQLNTPSAPSSSANGHLSSKQTPTNTTTITSRFESDTELENGVTKKPGKSFYPSTDPFSLEDEAHRPPRELYKYLKQKLKWAQSANEELQRELEGYRKRRREAWVKKELLLERCLSMELGEDSSAVSIWEKKKDEKGDGELDIEMKEVGEDEDDEDEGEGDGGREMVIRDVGDGEGRDKDMAQQRGDDERDEDADVDERDGDGEDGEDEYATEEE